MQIHIPVILAGMCIACAPASPSEDERAALTRDVEMREVRVAQVSSLASAYQDKKKAPPVVKKDVRFTPPRFKTAEEIERDQQKPVVEKVKFAPPRMKTAQTAPPPPKSATETERDRLDGKTPAPSVDQQKKQPIRKVKVNEKTGEARLYDANNKDITETVSPRTNKVKVVTEPSGKWKLLDENGKQVTEGPAAPPPPPPPPPQPKTKKVNA